MTTSWLARGRSGVRSIHIANVLLRILAMEATSSSAALGRISASTSRGHCMITHVTVLRMRGLAAKVTRLGTRCERPLRCTGWSHLLLGHVNELWYKRKTKCDRDSHLLQHRQNYRSWGYCYCHADWKEVGRRHLQVAAVLVMVMSGVMSHADSMEC